MNQRRELALAIDGLLDALWIPVAVEKAEGRISPIEAQLADLLAGTWTRQFDKALDALTAMFAGATGEITAAEVEAALALLARMLGPDLAGITADQAGKLVGLGYLSGRNGLAKSLDVKPTLSLADRRAQEILSHHTVYWIGNHYDDALRAGIEKTVQETAITYGAGRAAVGKALKEALGHVADRSDVYWRGLAAVTMTRSRSLGAVQSLVEAGWEEYEVLAVMDERTSDVCRRMNGRIFRVERAVELRDALLAAKTPEDVKTLAPWLPAKKIKGPTEDLPGGLALPPYHFHCRTTVVARVEAPGTREARPEASVTKQQQKVANRLNDFTPAELANRVNGLKGAGFTAQAAEEHLGKPAGTAAVYELTQRARKLMRAADQVHAYLDGDELLWVFRAGGQQVVLNEDAWTVLSIGQAPITPPAAWLPVVLN